MNKKQMTIIYGSAKESSHRIFKTLINGDDFYIQKHDKRMKQLFDTGKIKEFMTTEEINRAKKEAARAKKRASFEKR